MNRLEIKNERAREELAMKISIDYDGTMWSHMAFFREFMKAMQAAGHKVGCLTAHFPHQREQDIALMASRGFPLPDFWLGHEGDGWTKPSVIIREGIDIHFDDGNGGGQIPEYRQQLGEQSYRLITVECRVPMDKHYE
jgi:hypothetical protein